MPIVPDRVQPATGVPKVGCAPAWVPTGRSREPPFESPLPLGATAPRRVKIKLFLWWCPGSTADKVQVCGSEAVYCPEGSAEPVVVAPGYYSTNGPVWARTAIAPAQPG